MSKKKEYHLIENYTMKCRLYPNKEQKRKIEDILWGKKVCNNVVMYDMFTNQKNVTERKDKDGNIVHYPKLNQAAKAEYLNELREEYPVIKKVPAVALSGNNGLILNDMKKSLLAQVDKNNSKRGTAMKPIESSKPHYYCKKKPCMSYTYQERLSKIEIKTNNVLFVSLNGVGNTKVRGWNTKIRFENGYSFDEYIKNNHSKQITVNISKDKCGDYYISFKLQNVLKPINKVEDLGEIGIDVGVKDVAILSDGTKLKNEHLRRNKKQTIKVLHKMMARRYGPSNEKFRKDFKLDKKLKPSKRYEQARLSYAKLERKISRKRDHLYHNFTTKVVEENKFIGVETLNITGMFRNRHLAYSLSDAAMGTILSMIDYKSDWYNRDCKAIGRWTPSSKRCNSCGYIYKDLTLKEREWRCPICGEIHDRDINAAKNIYDYAKGLVA